MIDTHWSAHKKRCKIKTPARSTGQCWWVFFKLTFTSCSVGSLCCDEARGEAPAETKPWQSHFKSWPHWDYWQLHISEEIGWRIRDISVNLNIMPDVLGGIVTSAHKRWLNSKLKKSAIFRNVWFPECNRLYWINLPSLIKFFFTQLMPRSSVTLTCYWLL